jgi:hypothetical protein
LKSLIAVLTLGIILAGCAKKEVPWYDEPTDFVGCRQAAIDHRSMLTDAAFEYIINDCAKYDQEGYDAWVAENPNVPLVPKMRKRVIEVK